MSLVARKPVFGFPTRSDTNRAVQPLKMARGSKFPIKKVEGLFCLYSENKGADQLCGYRTADPCLCFRICKNQFSHDAAHKEAKYYTIRAVPNKGVDHTE